MLQRGKIFDFFSTLFSGQFSSLLMCFLFHVLVDRLNLYFVLFFGSWYTHRALFYANVLWYVEQTINGKASRRAGLLFYEMKDYGLGVIPLSITVNIMLLTFLSLYSKKFNKIQFSAALCKYPFFLPFDGLFILLKHFAYMLPFLCVSHFFFFWDSPELFSYGFLRLKIVLRWDRGEQEIIWKVMRMGKVLQILMYCQREEWCSQREEQCIWGFALVHFIWEKHLRLKRLRKR